MIPALISQIKGIAIFDDGAQFGVLDVLRMNMPFFCDEQRAMHLISDAPDLEHLEVIDVASLRTHLLIRKSREELLRAALILLDGERSAALREQAARALSEHHAFDEWDWVEGVLLSTTLPQGADALGATRWPTPYKTFFLELLSLQEQIKTLQIAWRVLPSTLFTSETREQAYARIVRQGVFRSLLKGGSLQDCSPFTTALGLYQQALTQSGGNRAPFPERQSVLNVANTSNKSSKLIWELSPWRSGWFHSAWSQIEPILATHAAEHLVLHCVLHSKKSFKTPDWVHAHLCDSWDAMRNDSDIFSSIELLSALTSVVLSSGQAHLTNINENGSVVEKLLQTASLGLETTKHWLKTSILDIFGVTPFLSKFGPTDAVSGRNIANETYHAPNLRIPFAADMPSPSLLNLIDFGSYASDRPQRIDEMKNVMGLYALDRLFQHGGCVVLIMPERKPSKKATRHLVSLLNFSTRRSQMFDGHAASILENLQARLTADLKSGLPSQHCGWMPIEEIGIKINQNLTMINGAMDDIFQNTLRAGFSSETFQIGSGGVRLNPEFAASTFYT